MLARLVADRMAMSLGQSVIIDNRGGAGGALAARAVALAEPDGYTLLFGNTATLANIPAVSRSAGYDPSKSFSAVAKVMDSYMLLVVRPDFPATSVAELVAYAAGTPWAVRPELSVPGSDPARPATMSEKNTPIDSTMPAFWNVARMPDAAPRRCDGTLDITSDVFGAAKSPPPAVDITPIGAGAPSSGELADHLRELELRLSRMVAEPPATWNIAPLEQVAEQLLARADTGSDREAPMSRIVAGTFDDNAAADCASGLPYTSNRLMLAKASNFGTSSRTTGPAR